ncbi:sensor histidine kinase [Amycolatopsis sp. EV170708-02-1]|uniref:sensor histidine kinase n=1 Tax=Amycolatopsis sp. EV170708-02-1 TaxID=2919322 RepID=UPI001F0B9A6F|nr:ATP-binding protein [Amycolatopsis sp. EV170708-02-1]UMP02031.1 histidine kinase [Amycolatopsis sp. EV170708-02-1]
MGRTAAVLVATATVLLVTGVVASVDWSTAAIHDPARALTLGPLEAFVADRSGLLPAFDRIELITFLVAGVASVVSGAVVWRFRPDALTGRLIVLAGLLWLASGIRRSSDPQLFTAGVVLTHTALPLAIQVALGYPTGRLRRRWEKWYIAGCWLVATFGIASEWLFFDPLSTSAVHPSTSHNLLLIRHIPALAVSIQLTVGIVTSAMAVALIWVLVSRWRSGTQPYRAEFAPVAIGALFAFVVFAAGLLMATHIHLPGPQNSWMLSLRNPTMALLPVVVAFVVSRYHFARAAIRSAMIEIGAAPISDGFVDALRRALRDPSLVLWTYSEKTDCYLDDDGVPKRLSHVPPSRGVTTLESNGVPVGAVVYDESLSAHPELLAAVHSAATLALEHERLRNELQARLIEVKRSRERIVTAGDIQRRRLERDLHDGAQQHLITARIHLSRAKQASDNPHVRELVEHGAAELRTALTELRNLARGVYPAALTDGGLPAALTSLAERTPLPVEIDDATGTRPPARIELAAYFIAAEAVTNACKHAEASHVEIRLRHDDAALRLDVRDDGRGGAALTTGGGLSGLSDRAIALGGTLTVDSPIGGGTTLTAVLPLADGDHRFLEPRHDRPNDR